MKTGSWYSYGITVCIAVALAVACSGAGAPALASLEQASKLAAEGRLAEAEGEVDRFITENPGEEHRAGAHLRRGCIKVERGDARGALEDLKQADMILAEGRTCRGKALALLARHEEALADLGWVVEQGNFDAEVLGLAVRSALALRRTEAAYELAEKGSQKFPSNVDTLVLWAQTQAVAGKTADALETLRFCQMKDRRAPQVYFVKGNILWATEKYIEAVTAYEKALELNPQFPEALRNMGVALIQSARYDEAAKALLKASDMLPDDVQLLNNLGVALAATGRLDEAAIAYERAVKMAPEQPLLLNNLADIYVRLGRVDEALAAVEQLVVAAPGRGNALKMQMDLVALQALGVAVCSKGKRKGISAVEEAFAKREWSGADALKTLERVLADPIFTQVLEARGKQCQ